MVLVRLVLVSLVLVRLVLVSLVLARLCKPLSHPRRRPI